MIRMEPVWVAGKGLVAPKGWISPETRALMEQAQRECAEAATHKGTSRATEGDTGGTPSGYVTDPCHGQR